MLDIVILAAGMGTRMKSDLPKVLHPVAGRPMLAEVLATARALEPQRTVVVVGHGAEPVRALAGEDVGFVLQEPQLGTGHAVAQAVPLLGRSGAETVLVLYGDTPLIRAETLRAALVAHGAEGAAVTVLSFLPLDPTGYGRIVRDAAGGVQAIVEQRDASDAQRAIQESNSGILLFQGVWLRDNLPRLTLSAQGEYYLTDTVALAVAQGTPVAARVVDEHEVMGVNTRVQLAQASDILWERRRTASMLAGVTLVDPRTVWLDAEVRIGRDTVLHPNVMLRGRTTVGAGCEIGPFALLEDATVSDGTRVEPFSHVRV